MEKIQRNCDDIYLIQIPNPCPSLVVLNLRNLLRNSFFFFSLCFISYYRENSIKLTLYCICQAFCLCFSNTRWRYCFRVPITTNPTSAREIPTIQCSLLRAVCWEMITINQTIHCFCKILQNGCRRIMPPLILAVLFTLRRFRSCIALN